MGDAPQQRHATAAIIGAGDYIGAAVARKFAVEGYHVLAGRRSGDKLAPLVRDIEVAGGRCTGLALDARDEAQVSGFLAQADSVAPLEVCIFNVGGNVPFRCWTPLSGCSEKSGKWPAMPGF